MTKPVQLSLKVTRSKGKTANGRSTVSAIPLADSKYRVGPGHPPRDYQFKKGQSGNPLGGKLKKRSVAPDLKVMLQRALNQKVRGKQGKQILTKAATGMQRLVDQFAQGDSRARRDLMQISDKLGIDLTAGQRDALQRSVAAALTKNDQELVDEFIDHYLAEREAQQRLQQPKPRQLTVIGGEGSR